MKRRTRGLCITSVKLIFCIIAVLLVHACGKKVPVQTLDDHQLLAQALSKNDEATVQSIREKLRLTENTQNIIDLYFKLGEVAPASLNARIDYLQQFNSSMKKTDQRFVRDMAVWIYSQQIYQQEISPPVRILQREKLYLAPSGIDFSKCADVNTQTTTQCAIDLRKKLMPLITGQDLVDQLKKMANNDPCVNLSNILKGEEIAHRCLKKSKGQLKIELLPKPRFSYEQWLQLVTVNKL